MKCSATCYLLPFLLAFASASTARAGERPAKGGPPDPLVQEAMKALEGVPAIMAKSDEFEKRSQESRQKAGQVPTPEHKAFGEGLQKQAAEMQAYGNDTAITARTFGQFQARGALPPDIIQKLSQAAQQVNARAQGLITKGRDLALLGANLAKTGGPGNNPGGNGPPPQEAAGLIGAINKRRPAVEVLLRSADGLIAQLGKMEKQFPDTCSPQGQEQVQTLLRSARSFMASAERLLAEIKPLWERLGNPGPGSATTLGWVGPSLNALDAKANAIRDKSRAIESFPERPCAPPPPPGDLPKPPKNGPPKR